MAEKSKGKGRAGHNKIAVKVRVNDHLYGKLVMESGQARLTMAEFIRRILEDRYDLRALPGPGKPVALNAAARPPLYVDDDGNMIS